jgi:hypothetical protein
VTNTSVGLLGWRGRRRSAVSCVGLQRRLRAKCRAREDSSLAYPRCSTSRPPQPRGGPEAGGEAAAYLPFIPPRSLWLRLPTWLGRPRPQDADADADRTERRPDIRPGFGQPAAKQSARRGTPAPAGRTETAGARSARQEDQESASQGSFPSTASRSVGSRPRGSRRTRSPVASSDSADAPRRTDAADVSGGRRLRCTRPDPCGGVGLDRAGADRHQDQTATPTRSGSKARAMWPAITSTAL